VPEHIWQQVVAKRRAEGHKRVWWRPAHLGCWNGQGACVTRGKSYRRCGRYSAAYGTVLCYQDSVTGQRWTWPIDGVEESAIPQ
jgi:hypothetical protein